MTPATTNGTTPTAPPPEPIDRTVREGIGSYERRAYARATATLAPGDVSPVVLKVGAREYKAKREAGWNVSLAKTITADANRVVNVAVRGDALDIVAVAGGEQGNEILLSGVGLIVPPRPEGGRVHYIAFLLEWDGVTCREHVLGVKNSPAEAQAIITLKTMAMSIDKSRGLTNTLAKVRPPHTFLRLGGEVGCAHCGKAADDAAHAV